MSYEEFLMQKKRVTLESGFTVGEKHIHPLLFDFQNYAVRKALSYGRYALFEECGLGKTLQQLEWARHVVSSTNESVLILAPLGVTGQTVKEAEKLGLDVIKYGARKSDSKIYITNYEQIDKIDPEMFSGIVLDESSILKNFEGSTKKKILSLFKMIPYKLACTATPSPNDDMEICNHAEFLGHGRREEILAMYFTHDGGETATWRLKGHAQKMFWNFVRSWSLFISNPADVGFDGSMYALPKLNLIERMIAAPVADGRLFNDLNVNATNFNQELRSTMKLRIKETCDIVNNSPDSFIVWCKQNPESEALADQIDGAVEVTGSEAPEAKEEKLLAFAAGQIHRLVTKTKIAGFGLNYQNCHNHVHCSFDFSFEALYQSIRRSYRFGQKHPVNIWLITTDSMRNVIQSIKEKQEQFEKMKYHLTMN